MAIQFSTSVRNAMLDAIETTTSTSAKLRLLTGSAPANCAAAETGTLLIEFALASDWWAAASSGAKVLNNLPLSGSASASGSFGYFRITNTAGSTCHVQGTCGTSGDLTTDSASVTSGQTVNVTGFTMTAPGA